MASVSISVTFDRPVTAATFVTGDVQVFFHDTTNGDPSVPLTVTGVTPVAGSGSGPDGYHPVHDHLQPHASRREPGNIQLHRHLQLSDRSGQRLRPCHQLADREL